MKNLNYDVLMQINNDIYQNLEKYISIKKIRDELYNKVMLMYPLSLLDEGSTAFNLWLICDYKDEEGKTVIDKYLEDNFLINSIEKEILTAKKMSYPSLYEILEIKNEIIIANNVFTAEVIEILEPSGKQILKTGDYFLARIDNVLKRNLFSGEIIYAPKSVVPYFIKEVLYDFNYELSKDFSLSFSDYVKNNYFRFYDMFYMNAYEHFNPSKEDALSIYEDIEEFQNYIKLKRDPSVSEKYINKLFEIYEYYLDPEDLSLRDLNKVDLIGFFKDAINEGFIISSESFSLYLEVLTEYIMFKSTQTKDFSNSLKQIKMIRENRFDFIKEIPIEDSYFCKDTYLISKLSKLDLTISDDFIKDFYVFLIYLISNPLTLTEKKQKIKKADKLVLLDSMFGSYEIGNDLKLNFDVLDVFKVLGLSLEVLEIKNNQLVPSNIVEDYLILTQEEKMQVILSEIFKIDFIRTLFPIDLKKAEYLKDSFIIILNDMVRSPLSLEDLIHQFTLYDKELSVFLYILHLIGLIEFDGKNKLILTSIGKVCLPFINQWDRRKMDNILIFTPKKSNI
ncbi:hypothetical protein E4100_06705 [Soehngenia longivitae]|uniref:Uncharacterized protein n=1 Tax=Soehngenia longivitae TaxID=2562294 RepID=A0A4Z0D5D4_9FIRM|nr:hypothetical protein [Soehngenia longivitae]TFZ39949.1 hypothetical protein E4100_06705 [Soehngenia longivitae]